MRIPDTFVLYLLIHVDENGKEQWREQFDTEAVARSRAQAHAHGEEMLWMHVAGCPYMETWERQDGKGYLLTRITVHVDWAGETKGSVSGRITYWNVGGMLLRV